MTRNLVLPSLAGCVFLMFVACSSDPDSKQTSSSPDASAEKDECTTWTDCAKTSPGDCCVLASDGKYCAAKEDALASGKLYSCK